MTVVEAHAAYESRHPDEQEYAEQVEGHRQAVWLRSHDTLDGYRSLREFPCTGTLRIVDQNKTHRIIACDGCSFVTTAPIRLKVGQEAW